MEMKHLPKFAVLQLSGCAGCEVSLLNAEEWIDQFNLVYMPLAVSAHEVPPVDVLLVSGGVQNSQDIYKLKTASKKAGKVVAVGTCAISGGVANLGNREDVRQFFLSQENRLHLPHILPKSKPIDYFVTVDQYLPGCPPTPELFMALLLEKDDFKPSKTVCQECGRIKVKDMRPEHFIGFQKGEVLPDICLINQGYPCVGTSTRGGCMALCTRPGHPCVGCRGPSDAFIEKEAQRWLTSVQKVFEKMTDVPPEEIYEILRSPQLSLFLFQFSDYAGFDLPPRSKEKVL